MSAAASDHRLPPEPVRRHRVFGGLNERQEHIFTWIAVVVVLLFVAGWVGAVADLRDQQREIAAAAHAAGVPAAVAMPPVPASRQITGVLLDPKAPTTAFINDAMLEFLDPLRGESGKLRFTTATPGSQVATGAPQNATAVFTGGEERVETGFVAPDKPGVYKLSVQVDQATSAIRDLSVVTLVPFAEKQKGRIGLYYLGSWPFENGGTPPKPSYANPNGFIEVTRENQETNVSEHFKLRDFLTKDQANIWPKYLLLNPKLIDKLELIIEELQAMGIPVNHVTIMSGFRTPRYNVGGGNTEGRANLSRHMYGDASDIFVDNDGNGVMDDLNHDGRVDARDAEVILQAAERVERKTPSLVGGVGVYSACCGHGPFTHIDVRGFRARWRGTGNG